ncbi:MAG: hypothetical protein ABSD49_04985 [Candidatus Bathyarchaeia archaeon]
MESDRIRRALSPYLADLDIVRDDAGGCTVKPFRNVDDDKIMASLLMSQCLSMKRETADTIRKLNDYLKELDS